MKFSEIDFLILDFVKNNSPVHINKIFEKFPVPDFNTRFRLQQLQKENHIDFLLTESGFKFDYLVIRPQGVSALQDYFFKKAQDRDNFRREILKLSLATALGYFAKSLIDFIFE